MTKNMIRAFWGNDGHTRGWCFGYKDHEGLTPGQWAETECGPHDLTDDRVIELAREYAQWCGAEDWATLPVEITRN